MPISGELPAQGIGWQPAAGLTGPVYAWVTNIASGERSPGTLLVPTWERVSYHCNTRNSGVLGFV
jgi:hypothetical protein